MDGEVFVAQGVGGVEEQDGGVVGARGEVEQVGPGCGQVFLASVEVGVGIGLLRGASGTSHVKDVAALSHHHAVGIVVVVLLHVTVAVGDLAHVALVVADIVVHRPTGYVARGGVHTPQRVMHLGQQRNPSHIIQIV